MDFSHDSSNGTEILSFEVIHCIKQLKDRKAVGPDEILAQVIKLITQEQIYKILDLFNNIYNSGKIPQDWLTSTILIQFQKNVINIALSVSLAIY